MSKKGSNPFTAFMETSLNFQTEMMLLPFKMYSASDSASDDIDNQRRFTTREIERLVEEGVLEEPDKYDFQSYREMKRFLQGRHEEAERNNIELSDRVPYEEAVRSFTSAFYPEAEDVQKLLESTRKTDHWEVQGDMPEILREYERLVQEGEAEIGLSSGNEELILNFTAENGLYPEIEILYREGEQSYSRELGELSYEELPETLDQLPAALE